MTQGWQILLQDSVPGQGCWTMAALPDPPGSSSSHTSRERMPREPQMQPELEKNVQASPKTCRSWSVALGDAEKGTPLGVKVLPGRIPAILSSVLSSFFFHPRINSAALCSWLGTASFSTFPAVLRLVQPVPCSEHLLLSLCSFPCSGTPGQGAKARGTFQGSLPSFLPTSYSSDEILGDLWGF